MPTGTLVHITAAKKLMIKISEKTYDNIHGRLYNECKKKNFQTERLAVYSRENDDGDENYFAMVTLDEWDRQNMPKFKQLLRKDISFQTFMKPYDFMNDDNEQICGINLVLTAIRQIKPKITIEWDQKTPSKDEILEMAARVVGVTLIKDSEIDEIADKAAARACSQETELNAEEQAIDEDVEKQVLKRFPSVVINPMNEAEKEQVKNKVNARTAQLNKLIEEAEGAQKNDSNDLPMAPPKLERQSAMTHRRRRVQPSEESIAAADYQMPEEIKAFAIIDAFEQEE